MSIDDDLDPEMEFISGRIFDLELPENKQYLWKYFKTKLQRQFVKYYLTFETTARFTERTGYYCSDRWIRMLLRKIKRLEKANQDAQEAAKQGDFQTLADLKSGKCRKFRSGRNKKQ